jgi:hypothetical protein
MKVTRTASCHTLFRAMSSTAKSHRRRALAVFAATSMLGAVVVGSATVASSAGEPVPTWLTSSLVIVGDLRVGATQTCISADGVDVRDGRSDAFRVSGGVAECQFFGGLGGVAEPVTLLSAATVGVAPKITGVVVTGTNGTDYSPVGTSQTRTCTATATGSPAPTVFYRWIEFQFNEDGDPGSRRTTILGYGSTFTFPAGATAQVGGTRKIVYCQAFAANAVVSQQTMFA